MGIGVSNAKFVLLLKIEKIDISELVGVACRMTDNLQLQSMDQGKDLIVFEKLKMYFSTGGEVLEKPYERGIHIRGRVRFFDKSGEFEGKFNEDGVMVKAGIDNFDIWGLEVKSARVGGERASMDIEMTSERQKIFIDGMITYCDYELKTLINADIQNRLLFMDISVAFPSIAFTLQARVEVPNTQTLEGLVGEFKAELHPDYHRAIFDGIQQGIESIEKFVTEEINAAQAGLRRQIDENQEKLNQIKEDLDELRLEAEEEKYKRQRQRDKETKELEKATLEMERLQAAVREAEAHKHKNQVEISKQKASLEQAKRKHDQKERRELRRLDREIENEKAEQKRLAAKQKKLQEEIDALWGDDLRKFNAAKNWVWWESKFITSRKRRGER